MLVPLRGLMSAALLEGKSVLKGLVHFKMRSAIVNLYMKDDSSSTLSKLLDPQNLLKIKIK